MNETEFSEILARGYELRNVEHKGPGLRTDKAFLARVTRAVLGMANLRDGGLVTIGVADDRGRPDPIGLDATQLGTWQRYEDVVASIASFAQPSVEFDLDIFGFRGASIALLRVREFALVPVLCAENAQDSSGKQILRRGACYVRPRRRVETSELADQEDMRDLLDLAIEKGVRRFVAVAGAAGLSTAGADVQMDRYDSELDNYR
jgi:hypothetical protein